ncbi:hypothetical protein DB347_19650 [Opitutaceae bacterium EW11]|nr:hypothetical protein DB347_19650 [Opitutaceae bacterium EW11]
MRWSVDAWRTFQDTEGRRTRRNETFELWRVEVAEVAAVGWRDGSIGGPNGEQPSSGVWLLWGRNREQLRALPRGSSAPAFEYAVFVRHGETTRWDNNEGENFRIGLGALPEIERARGSLNDFPKSQREE